MWPASIVLLVVAVDPFEIQVYDGTANAPLRPGLEVHTNVRRSGEVHLTFEPSFGITRWLEVGGYVETSLHGFEGVKLRAKLVTPASVDERWRLGLNVELAYERGAWGGELRPIIAFESERWAFALNPIVDLAEGTLEPAASAAVKLKWISVGLEYYGSWSSAPEHYLYEVVNLLAVDWLELNVGIGEGLTPDSDPWVLKTIVGVSWP